MGLGGSSPSGVLRLLNQTKAFGNSRIISGSLPELTWKPKKGRLKSTVLLNRARWASILVWGSVAELYQVVPEALPEKNVRNHSVRAGLCLKTPPAGSM